jgi:hypothetical protein
VGLGIGYKIGFFNRNKENEPDRFALPPEDGLEE